MAKYKKLKIVCDACCHKPNAHLGFVGKGKSAGGIIFLDEEGTIISEFGVYLGDMTPPQAEYTTMIRALDKAASICRGVIEVWLDSEFVVKQMNGDYGIKSDNMKPLYDEAKKLERRFTNVEYFHHGRNSALAKTADQLAEREYRKHQS
ncbi:MAG: Ribonuclease H [Parcubacteria group bacterium GW2011_GWA1_51_12]|nr:MAG: Ribonuclease H [Parcubacteria group bacterium GW2011_GWA1_51_12]